MWLMWCDTHIPIRLRLDKYNKGDGKLNITWCLVAISGNFSYELPYPVHPFFEIKDTFTYICVCLYLALAIPIIACGYCGPDGFVLSMALHICGQFATLSCKINNLLKDHENYHRHMRNIILRHRHLITWVLIYYIYACT